MSAQQVFDERGYIVVVSQRRCKVGEIVIASVHKEDCRCLVIGRSTFAEWSSQHDPPEVQPPWHWYYKVVAE